MPGHDSRALLPAQAGARGLGPRDVAFVLFRRRWIILAIAVPIILAGGASLLGRTRTYTAAARVLVEMQNVDQPRWNTAGRAIDYDRELSTLINIAMSVTVAEKAAAALEDSLPSIRRLDPNLAELAAGPAFRDFLLAGLDINTVSESNILEFRQTSEVPEVALMAVGALRDAFIDYYTYGRRNPGTIQYYNEQIGTVRAEIDSLLQVRGAILTAAGYATIEDEMRYSTGIAADIEGSLRRVQVEREQLETEYALLKSYLDRDPRDFPAGQDESRASTLVGWRALVGKHEDALNSILSVHTEDSLPARQQRKVLEGALEKLRAEEIAYTESVRIQLESTRQRERTLQGQFDAANAANKRLPMLYQQVSMLDSDIKSLRDLLDDLQGKWGEVRMSEMADDRVSQFVILTQPEMVTVIAGGKTMIYLVMVVLLGLAFGIVAAFVQETLDHRVYAPRDVEDNLKLPVLASVTRTD